MKVLKEKKAQASIEVLLLIGGAIIVAVIVGIALKGVATNTANEAGNQVSNTANRI